MWALVVLLSAFAVAYCDCVATAILRLMENERAMTDNLRNDPFSWNVCTSWLRTPNT